MYTHCLLILLWFHLICFFNVELIEYIFLLSMCVRTLTHDTRTYARLEHFTFNVCMYIVLLYSLICIYLIINCYTQTWTYI